MKVAAVGLGVAALVAVGRVPAQPATTQGANTTCSADGTSTGTPCTIPHASDPSQNDLTPTQFLFGHDIGTKLAQTPAMVSLVASTSNSGWAVARARADNALSATAREVRSDTRPRTALRDATDAQSPSWSHSLTPQQFLIEEWRRSEVNVADSVYHGALMRIAATFDSTQRAQIGDADRTRILRRLDALVTANNYTWVMFRSQIKRRADSALAALKATD